jgi:hypothetical protein
MARPCCVRVVKMLCLIATLAGCSTQQSPLRAVTCPADQGTPMLVFQLFLGASVRGQGEVTDQAWRDFVDQVVTPNLPNGYTVFDGTGAWLDPATTATIHEKTRVLLAALPDTPAAAASIARVRESYASQFRQSLVGMTVAPACASF